MQPPFLRVVSPDAKASFEDIAVLLHQTVPQDSASPPVRMRPETDRSWAVHSLWTNLHSLLITWGLDIDDETLQPLTFSDGRTVLVQHLKCPTTHDKNERDVPSWSSSGC